MLCLGFFSENGPDLKMKSTGVDRSVLVDIGRVFSTPPDENEFKDFTLHSGQLSCDMHVILFCDVVSCDMHVTLP